MRNKLRIYGVALLTAALLVSCSKAVSYTHLDVYKRQEYMCCFLLHISFYILICITKILIKAQKRNMFFLIRIKSLTLRHF